MTFTIRGAPRTKKNSRVWTSQRVLIPSHAYARWLVVAMSQSPVIRQQLRSEGIELPLTGPIRVAAIFYRATRTGDLSGYIEALGDFLQTAKALPNGRTRCNGAGIIDDDKQIVSWDGSRLELDRAKPRIEVTIVKEEVST